MADWIETAKITAQIVGALGVAALAKLYHDRVVTEKNIALERKEAELDRAQDELNKALARAADAERLQQVRAHADLAVLRDQLAAQLAFSACTASSISRTPSSCTPISRVRRRSSTSCR